MNLKAIVTHAIEQQNILNQYERLADIYSGNLVSYVKVELAKELSESAFKIASQRIASINLIERITNKLSKVYSDTPARATLSDSDTQIIGKRSISPVGKRIEIPIV